MVGIKRPIDEADYQGLRGWIVVGLVDMVGLVNLHS